MPRFTDSRSLLAATLLAVSTLPGCWEQVSVEWFPQMKRQLAVQAFETLESVPGMTRVEAGAQGEHKLARGYLPSEIHSLHWIGDPSFRRAVAQYLEEERRAIGQEIDLLTSYGPFRHIPADE